jgi:hypothetical protein
VVRLPVLGTTINPADMGRLRVLYVAPDRPRSQELTVTFNESMDPGAFRQQVVRLDDITSGLDDAGAGLRNDRSDDPRSGAFFNDGADGDVRAGTEQLFDQVARIRDFDVEVAQAAPIADPQIGGRYYRGIGIGGGAGGAGGGGGGHWTAARRAGVLSLDVPIPGGGRVYRFRKENGGPELEIEIHDPATGRGWRGLLWLAVALGGFVTVRSLDRRRIFPGFRAVVAGVLALVAMTVYGAIVPGLLVLIVAAIAAFVAVRRANG